MTSRTPREPRLRLVQQAPLQRAAAARRSHPGRRAPAPPRGIAPQGELARHARAQLAGAVSLARWAQRTGASPEAVPVQAASDLGMTISQVRDHWGRARLAGLIEPGPDGGGVRAGWRLRAWDRDDTAALRGWLALFDAWSLTRPAPADADPSAVADVVAAVPQLLSVMQLSHGPVTAAGLIDLLHRRITELRAARTTPPAAATSAVPAGSPRGGATPATGGAAPAATAGSPPGGGVRDGATPAPAGPPVGAPAPAAPGPAEAASGGAVAIRPAGPGVHDGATPSAGGPAAGASAPAAPGPAEAASGGAVAIRPAGPGVHDGATPSAGGPAAGASAPAAPGPAEAASGGAVAIRPAGPGVHDGATPSAGGPAAGASA
ncbi:hypothetical protein RM780_07445, partial [Streptomyces sp. DSM 44917]